MNTWQRYDLCTCTDGTITGVTATNDNDDDGYPDNDVESWEVRYRNREEMIKRTGGSHIGCSGISVTVYLDGREVSR